MLFILELRLIPGFVSVSSAQIRRHGGVAGCARLVCVAKPRSQITQQNIFVHGAGSCDPANALIVHFACSLQVTRAVLAHGVNYTYTLTVA